MGGMSESELQSKTTKELMALADEGGVAEHLVDQALDADDPKAAMIALIANPGAAAAAAAGAPGGRPKLFNGTRTDGWGKANMIKAAANVDGDRDAQYWLGRRFLEGRTVRQSTTEGVRWLRKAAGQGSYPAQCHLGKWYSEKQVQYNMKATHSRYTGKKDGGDQDARAAKEREAQAAEEAKTRAAARAAADERRKAAEKAEAEKAAAKAEAEKAAAAEAEEAARAAAAAEAEAEAAKAKAQEEEAAAAAEQEAAAAEPAAEEPAEEPEAADSEAEPEPQPEEEPEPE